MTIKSSERTFVNNMVKSFDSHSFQPNCVGFPILDMDEFHSERLAETIIYIVDAWANAYEHDNGVFPRHIAEFGFFMMQGFLRWEAASEFPREKIMKQRYEFLKKLREAQKEEN